VIRLPSSGIRAISASVRSAKSAKSGIRAGSGKAGAQETLRKHYYNAAWDLLEPESKKYHVIFISEMANSWAISIGIHQAGGQLSSGQQSVHR
jgi:hypothetical protein